jgi:hypothetical protein
MRRREDLEMSEEERERILRRFESLTVPLEEEAKIMVKYRLKDMGYEVEVGPLTLPEVELDVYGVSGDLCVVGIARLRASPSAIDELNGKVEALRRLRPDKLRPRLLKVVYIYRALPGLKERAEKEGVWVLKAAGDYAQDVVEPRF